MDHEEPFEQSPKYTNWRARLEKNQIKIEEIKPLHIERTDDGEVLYVLVHADTQTPEGHAMPPICLLKGDAVTMLVVLIDEQTDDKYVLLVQQRRIADGSLVIEHPAGMIDEGDGSPVEVAARELKEETDLDVSPDELVLLSWQPWFSASATSDERLYFFYLERRMPSSAIQAMHGKQTGEEEENEHTTLLVMPFPEAHRAVRNMHGVLGHLLYLKQIGDYEMMQRL